MYIVILLHAVALNDAVVHSHPKYREIARIEAARREAQKLQREADRMIESHIAKQEGLIRDFKAENNPKNVDIIKTLQESVDILKSALKK